MILLIDSYDSFSNNLSRLITRTTGKNFISIYNDTFEEGRYEEFVEEYLPSFEYIVIGPGPGTPAKNKDVGIIGWLIRFMSTHTDRLVPILGICLGFQSLCFEFGNPIKQLEDIKHGQIYSVVPILYPDDTNELFTYGVGQTATQVSIPSVRYHSLYVDITQLNDKIQPLAYCLEERNGIQEKILMAGRHKSLPFYGVQYHPESICSEGGVQLILNFDRIANGYNTLMRPKLPAYNDRIATKISELSSNENTLKSLSVNNSPSLKKYEVHLAVPKLDKNRMTLPVELCNYLHAKQVDYLFLNSASLPGRWSIIGLLMKNHSEIVTHSMDNPSEILIETYKSSKAKLKVLSKPGESIWTYLSNKMLGLYTTREEILDNYEGDYCLREFPFFGGFMGFISYEEGQHIDTKKIEPICNEYTPDIKLAFIERFMVYDSLDKRWFVVSIIPNDYDWCQETCLEIEEAHAKGVIFMEIDEVPRSIKDLLKKDSRIDIEVPCKDVYEEQFKKCQSYLHSGDSYELCLTTQLKIMLDSDLDSWDMYKILTCHKNPSPFSCYFNFGDAILLSSSPERFLSWRCKGSNKLVELRPIKGTVAKSDGIDFDAAKKILHTPKEKGENLMIVDLIRHDLHHYIDDVYVKDLMAVEEYETVYQLVSTIQGELLCDSHNGLDILMTSLPPGSMTGAPKKRSVEILQDIESMQPTSVAGGRRGIYSGVAGYWSITDEADWSVIIRSIYHYDDDKENSLGLNLWRIGAGGAITVLSEQEAEWQEMNLKLSSALQAFK